MLVEAGQRFTKLGDRLVVLAVTRELFGISLPAGHVAGDARLVLEAAQIRLRVHGLFEAAGRALRRPAAEEVGDHLDRDVRERPRRRQQEQHPDPDEVPAGLDHVHHEQHLDEIGKDQERGHGVDSPRGAAVGCVILREFSHFGLFGPGKAKATT